MCDLARREFVWRVWLDDNKRKERQLVKQTLLRRPKSRANDGDLAKSVAVKIGPLVWKSRRRGLRPPARRKPIRLVFDSQQGGCRGKGANRWAGQVSRDETVM